MRDPIKHESLEKIVHQYNTRVTNTDDIGDLFFNTLNAAYLAGRDRGNLAHPRYTRIDIEGREGYFATLKRKCRSNSIDIDILTPELELKSSVPADDYSQQLAAAEHLYQELEGYTPSKASLDIYMRPFEQLACNYPRGHEYERK